MPFMSFSELSKIGLAEPPKRQLFLLFDGPGRVLSAHQALPKHNNARAALSECDG